MSKHKDDWVFRFIRTCPYTTVILVFPLLVLFGAFVGFMVGDSYGTRTERVRVIKQVQQELDQLASPPIRVIYTDGRVED